MPHACNFTEPSLVIDSIDDAIWANNDLTNIVIPILGNSAALILEILAIDLSRKSVHNQRTSRDSDYRVQ